MYYQLWLPCSIYPIVAFKGNTNSIIAVMKYMYGSISANHKQKGNARVGALPFLLFGYHIIKYAFGQVRSRKVYILESIVNKFSNLGSVLVVVPINFDGGT